jgi:hypothetical protein
MDVTVYNQYPDIELVSPVCFCNRRKHYEYHVERMDIGTMMKVGFRFEFNKLSGGILVYKVQKKENTKYDYQHNTDITPTEAVEDISKMMRLLVVWKGDNHWRLERRILLVEHDNELVLNEDKLAKLYDKIYNMPLEVYNWTRKYDSDGIYKSTWLMYDDIVLEAADEVIYERGYELKITISKGDRNLDAMKPMWIDSTRQVSALMI